jgi:DNA polymerase II large subunit
MTLETEKHLSDSNINSKSIPTNVSIEQIDQELERYTSTIVGQIESIKNIISIARSKGYDPDRNIEVILLNGTRSRLKQLASLYLDKTFETQSENFSYQEAFQIAKDLLLGKYGFTNDQETLLNKAYKAAIILLTRGSTTSFLDAIKYSLERSNNGLYYIKMTFSKQIKTMKPNHIFFSLLIGEEGRKLFGLQRFNITASEDDEVSRYIEEVDILDASSRFLQYNVPKDTLIYCLQNLPFEIDAPPDQAFPIQNPKNLKRIRSNYVRKEAIKVLNDIIAAKFNENLSLAHSLGIYDWDWLEKLKMSTVIQRKWKDFSKPNLILSQPVRGAFRLRYGRSTNTAPGTVGVHPVVFELLDNLMVVGSRVYISQVGNATVASVDTIEPPIVKLSDGSVIRISDPKLARHLQNKITKILSYGDLLISVGHFYLRNRDLLPAGYEESEWMQDVQTALNSLNKENQATLSEHIKSLISGLCNGDITNLEFDEAFDLSNQLSVPLHPRFTFNWELLSVSEIKDLRTKIESVKIININKNNEVGILPSNIADILENLGIEYTQHEDMIHVPIRTLKILEHCLQPGKPEPSSASSLSNGLDYLREISGLKIRNKTGTLLAIRLFSEGTTTREHGRVLAHGLFPVGLRRGAFKDIVGYCKAPSPVEMLCRKCSHCGRKSPYTICPICDNQTTQIYYCFNCRAYSENETCFKCNNQAKKFSDSPIEWLPILQEAISKTQVQPYSPLRGIFKATGNERYVERIEKAILRQRHNLEASKDGTIKFLVINSVLTHFNARQIASTVEKLRPLGYNKDIYDRDLTSSEQLIQLKPQDIIIPYSLADQLRRVADFLDDILVRLYNMSPLYDLKNLEDLLGHLVVAASPDSSFGVVGRIIGFTEANVCFAHPIWHVSKVRNMEGNTDNISLLGDVLLNFSVAFLPNDMSNSSGTIQFIQERLDLSDLAPKSLVLDMKYSYDNKFYEATRKQLNSRTLINKAFLEPATVGETLRNTRIDFVPQNIQGLQNTPHTKNLSIAELIEAQLKLASRVTSLDINDISIKILQDQLVPRLYEDIKLFTTQEFKCKNCGETYRRPTLRGVCLSCEKQLQPTKSLEELSKLVELSDKIVSSVELNDNLKDVIKLAKENVELLKINKKQTTLMEYS